MSLNEDVLANLYFFLTKTLFITLFWYGGVTICHFSSENVLSTKEEVQPFLTDMICKYVFGRLPIIAMHNCWGTLYLINLTSLFTWQRGLGPLVVETSLAEQQDPHF